MKNSIKILAISLLIAGATMLTTTTNADNPPPPPGHGETGNVPGGGGPIGSGLLILLGLGAAYGGKKIYKMRKKLNLLLRRNSLLIGRRNMPVT